MKNLVEYITDINSGQFDSKTFIQECKTEKPDLEQAYTDFEKNKGSYMPSAIDETSENCELLTWCAFSVYLLLNNKNKTSDVKILYSSDFLNENAIQLVQAKLSIQEASAEKCLVSNMCNNIIKGSEGPVEVVCCGCKEIRKVDTKVDLALFKGKDTYVHDVCNCEIDRAGNIVKKNVNPLCPICHKQYVSSKDKSMYCKDCASKVTAVDAFKKRYYDKWVASGSPAKSTNDMWCSIKLKVSNICNYLMCVYKYYSELLEPPAGVLASRVNVDGKVSVVQAKVTDAGEEVCNDSGADGNLPTYWRYLYSGLRTNAPDKTFPEKKIEGVLGRDSDYYIDLNKMGEFLDCSDYVIRSTDLHKLYCFAGFHNYHISGYFKANGKVCKIKSYSTEVFRKFHGVLDIPVDSATEPDFPTWLYKMVDDAIWQFVYANRKYKGKNGKTMLSVSDDGDETIDVANALDDILAFFGRCLTSMFVLKNYSESCLQLDVFLPECTIGGTSIKYADASVNSLSGLCSDKTVQDYNRVFTNSGIVPSVLFCGKSETAGIPATLQEVLSSQYSFVLVTDSVKYLAYPLFAYKPISKLKEQGKLGDSSRVILGETMDGQNYFLTGLNTAEGVTLYADSRSGKGVMTLALLGSLLQTGNPLGYFDMKPDMCGILQKTAKTLRTNVLAVELSNKLQANKALETEPNAKKLDDEAYALVSSKQRMWQDKKVLEEVREQWNTLFGIDPFTENSIWEYLFYSRVVQLAYALQMMLNTRDKNKQRIMFILDEISTITAKPLNCSTTIAGYLKKAEPKKNGGVQPNQFENLKTFCKVFCGDSTQELTNMRFSTSDFMGWLDEKYTKKPLMPFFVIIGQRYDELASRSSNGKLTDNLTWFDLLYKRYSRDGITIQGNWHNNDVDNKTKEPKDTLDILKGLKDAPEYKAKYIHGGTNGVSGFFAVKQGAMDIPKIIRSYFVLNEASPVYIEGDSNVRQRVHSAMGCENITEYDANIDGKLNDIIFKDFNPTACTADTDVWHTFKPREEIAFLGYMKLVAGTDTDSFAKNLGAGYDLMTELFFNSVFGKVLKEKRGYTCIEDYIFDTSPYSFVPMGMLLSATEDDLKRAMQGKYYENIYNLESDSEEEFPEDYVPDEETSDDEMSDDTEEQETSDAEKLVDTEEQETQDDEETSDEETSDAEKPVDTEEQETQDTSSDDYKNSEVYKTAMRMLQDFYNRDLDTQPLEAHCLKVKKYKKAELVKLATDITKNVNNCNKILEIIEKNLTVARNDVDLNNLLGKIQKALGTLQEAMNDRVKELANR